jgi:hypothetical protein
MPGILEAFKTGGLSLLDGWFRAVPDTVDAIKKAEAALDLSRIKRR